MNYSFEYIDIILLAMIAGFIFLRLRGILGKRTGFEGKASPQFENILKKVHQENKTNQKEDFDQKAQNEFLKGAKIAYETIITDFSDNDNKLIASKPLLSKNIYDEFNKALKERSDRGHYAEITFRGIKSADIKDHRKINKALQVTVDFVSEIITCIRDKEKKIVSGNPEKIKTIYDTWTFSRDMGSTNPNWLLVNTLN
jgi:predicted lipid-binding transport protein (Tim44 family)